MNQKKSTKILIILIVVIFIIILLGGLILAYLTTDIFRSEKDLFFKYITQIGDSENGFLDNQLKEYFEKRKNTPYNDEGRFSANITAENGQEQFENIKNFNITYLGQVDAANSKSEQNISINYSDEVNFPVSYKQVENIVGLQTKYVGSKFVAVETENLETLINRSGMSIDIDINILKNISKVKLTEEQKNHIKNTYMGILNNNLGEEKFSKVEEGATHGYKLSLTEEDLTNILIKLLENLKDDEITIEIINKYLQGQENSSGKLTSDVIIEKINDFIEGQNLEIIVYRSKGLTNKVSILANDLKIDIQKENSQGKIKYNTTVEVKQDEDIVKFNLNSIYSGISSMQSINEVYELNVEVEKLKYKYTLENNIDFTNSANIEEFTSDNNLILTNYESEQVDNFMNALKERIRQVNKQQMEELGLEESENPIQYLIPAIEIFSMDGEFIGEAVLSEEEINTFNSKFENYEGTSQQPQTVKGLLSTILRNNETEENNDMKITELNFNGEEYEATEENITLIKDTINMEKNYRIEFEKDSDTGLIFRAVINEK